VRNLWGENGLVNGSMGTVRDIFWSPVSNTATDQPFGIMVEFDRLTAILGSDAPGQDHDVCQSSLSLPTSISKGPIVQEGCFLNCVTNAVRVHKSQGMSLASESVWGLSYVLSRG
jgi:hypothetical protein